MIIYHVYRKRKDSSIIKERYFKDAYPAFDYGDELLETIGEKRITESEAEMLYHGGRLSMSCHNGEKIILETIEVS